MSKLFLFAPTIDRTGEGGFRLTVGDETWHAGKKWIVHEHDKTCGPQVEIADGWEIKTWTLTRADDMDGVLYGWIGFNEVKRVLQ